MKGGYKIIDFKNVSLSGTPVTMTDVLVDLLNNYDKVVLLSNVVLSGSAKDDCFSTVLSDDAGGVKLNCYDGYISINSSGAVTYTVASASGMAEDISELQGDLADTNNMIAPAWSATQAYTKNAIVRDGGRLYKAKSAVTAGTETSNITYWEPTTEADELYYLNSHTKLIAQSGNDSESWDTKLNKLKSAFNALSYAEKSLTFLVYGDTKTWLCSQLAIGMFSFVYKTNNTSLTLALFSLNGERYNLNIDASGTTMANVSADVTTNNVQLMMLV